MTPYQKDAIRRAQYGLLYAVIAWWQLGYSFLVKS